MAYKRKSKNEMIEDRKQALNEITEKLENGIKNMMNSEHFKAYLNTMSKFHNYSFNNTILIAMQKPEATLVAGFEAWKSKFGRHVKKGEKGIKIFAPAPYKKKEQVSKRDEKGRIVFDDNGKAMTEEVEIVVKAFKLTTVYDISQTEGKELPVFNVDDLTGDVSRYDEYLKALEAISPVPVEFENIQNGAKGYFSPKEQKIVVDNKLSQVHTIKTLVHEISHSLLHDKEHERIDGASLDERKSRNSKEVEAESVAYTVCQHFGLDTSDYSFSYITGWCNDIGMEGFKKSLDAIRIAADTIISDMESYMANIERVPFKEQIKEAKQELEKRTKEIKNKPLNRNKDMVLA